ncbi:MAG: YggS family pyridoxal phosphate-dependent enzyme [Alkalispirochaeta sp.]
MGSIRENIARIEERIRRACDAAGRAREGVRLMAVSKLQPEERIREAIGLGLRLFGESRVQETKSRRSLFPEDAEVHLIGHMQRNKAKDAVQLYTAIQSIDAIRTVDALVNARDETTPPIDLCIEVNTSGEESKYGVHGYDELRLLAEKIEETPGFALRGLMTIGPLTGDEPAIRHAFATLREMRDRLAGETGGTFPELSMGMSGDLEAAIIEGSTMVRVGTAIFGPRIT